ncbi:MAG TPA: hypothetical protein VMM78_12110 [Thermomicrobiales bacterium]|nr:hypothetical protein [Thermomicrobiales bacterium]
MSADERRQADLLDSYWLGLKQRDSTEPPAGLDADIAALASALEHGLAAPEPSAAFTSALRQQLRTARPAAPANGVAPDPATPGPVLILPPVDAPPDALPRRAHWIGEVGKLAAAMLAFALVAGLLIALFGRSDGDDGVARDRDDPFGAIPDVTASSGEILIALDPIGNRFHKLYVVSVDGSEPRKLTPGPVDAPEMETNGAWSPDGSQIAYATGFHDASQLWLIDADGTDQRAIGPPLADIYGIDWSPDGTRLLFAGTPDGTSRSGLCVLPIADPAALTCTSPLSPLVHGSPSWSPDGERIVYVTVANRRRVQINIANADFSNPRAIAVGADPVWSPNGEWIAYTEYVDSIRGGSWVRLVSSDLLGDAQVVQEITSAEIMSWNARWSPDGSLVHVISDRGGSTAGIVVNFLDKSLRDVTELAGRFEVSVDGKTVAVIVNRFGPDGTSVGEALYAVNIDGSDERLLLEPSSLGDTLAWRPGQTHVAPSTAATATVEPPTSVLSPPPLETPSEPTAGAQAARDLIVPVVLSGLDNATLQLLDVDGGKEVSLTLDGADAPDGAVQPAWSPDGSSIAFVGWEDHGNSDVFVMRADGSEWRKLTTESGYYIDPTWSPDGSRIAYAGQDGDLTFIRVMDADGSSAREFTWSQETASVPTWSPDGQRLAFIRTRWITAAAPPDATTGAGQDDASAVERTTEWHLWVINADGTEERPLAAASYAARPNWSLDGREILYTAGWEGERQQARIVDVETGDIRALVSSAVNSTQPRWSPDGLWVSLAVVDPGGSEAAIVVVRPDGTEARRVSDVAGWWHDWSPDGAWIAVARYRLRLDGSETWESDLFLVSTSTGEERYLIEYAIIGRDPAWRPVAVTFAPERSPPVVEPVPQRPDGGLPSGISHDNAAGVQISLTVVLDDPQLMTVGDALAVAVDHGYDWSYGDRIDGSLVTIQTWHGLVSISSISAQLNTGEILQRIEDREAWVIDFGNVPGIIGAGCPGCPAPPEYNHSFIVIDARTGSVLLSSSYRSESGEGVLPRGLDVQPEVGTEIIPGAEVVHIVSIPASGTQDAVTMETWLDQRNGDLAVYHMFANGTVLSVTTIYGGTLTEYVPAQPGGESSVRTTSTEWPDDYDLVNATSHLYLYRDMLRSGQATVVGETMIGDRSALEVVATVESTWTVEGPNQQIIASYQGYRRDIVYLDPVTLLVVKGSDHPKYPVTLYPVLEELRRADVPEDVFRTEIVEAPNHSFSHRISLADARMFERFAVWGLGEAWEGFDLQRVGHGGHRRSDGFATESVTVTYTRVLGGREQRILIDSRGPLSEQEWEVELQSRFTGEAVTFLGEDGWLYTESADGSCRLELEWRGGYLEIHAPSVDVAFQVAADLRQVNAGSVP